MDQKYLCQSSKVDPEKRLEVLLALSEAFLGEVVIKGGDSSEEDEDRDKTKSHYVAKEAALDNKTLGPFEKA